MLEWTLRDAPADAEGWGVGSIPFCGTRGRATLGRDLLSRGAAHLSENAYHPAGRQSVLSRSLINLEMATALLSVCPDCL